MVDLQTITTMFGGIGVGVAAIYYIMTLKNAEKEKRRQMIITKLPLISREYYEWNLQIRNSWRGPEEWDRKYRLNPELESKVWYIMATYSVIGQLYSEGLMSLEEVAKAHTPGWMVSWWDMFEFYIKRIRYNSQGELVFPEYLADYERLCVDLRRRYRKITDIQRTLHNEVVELMKEQNSSQEPRKIGLE